MVTLKEIKERLDALQDADETEERKIDILVWSLLGYNAAEDSHAAWVSGEPLAPTEEVNGRTMSDLVPQYLDTDFRGIAIQWNVPRLTQSVDAVIRLIEMCEYEAWPILDLGLHSVRTILRGEPGRNDFTADLARRTLSVFLNRVVYDEARGGAAQAARFEGLRG